VEAGPFLLSVAACDMSVSVCVVRGSAGSSRDTGSSQLVLLPATALALVSQLSQALDTEAAWLVSS
jgi:hypothetical protein